MKYIQTLSVVFGVLLMASTAQALSTSANGNASADVGAGAGGTVQVGASGNGSASAGSESSMSSGTNSTSSSEQSASGQANASSGSSVQAGIKVGPIVVTRAEVDAIPEGQYQATVTTPAGVQSNTDLSVYATSVVKSDSDVSNADLTPAAVSLGYKQRAKLFGFIPIFLTATATVNADGETSVSYPWYAFLAATDSGSLKSDIEAATATTVAASGSANAQFSVAEQAQLLAEMHDAMKSHLQASLAAEGNSNVSAQ